MNTKTDLDRELTVKFTCDTIYDAIQQVMDKHPDHYYQGKYYIKSYPDCASLTIRVYMRTNKEPYTETSDTIAI